MLKESLRSPKFHHNQQVVLPITDLKVHESTMKNKLQTIDMHGRNMSRARLQFAHDRQGKDQDFLNNVLWTRKIQIYLAMVLENRFHEKDSISPEKN